MPLNEPTVEVNQASDDPIVGTMLAGRYQILAHIGVGGMGEVYKAKHKDTDSIVAIKLINPSLIADVRLIQRFRQEAAILGDLKHPNIVQVKAFEVDEGRCFMVLEYLDGKTLSEVIASEGPLSASEFSRMFNEIIQGLQCAHANWIIHRDLKPSNLMVVQDAVGHRHLKLMDFGVSKQMDGQAQQITQAGAIIGSPMYMSPEQFLGAELDARCDIYSLGCVMYFALTGNEPFQADNAMELAHKHIAETLPALSDSDKAQFNLLIQKATAKNPSLRYQSAEQLLSALLHGESEVINVAKLNKVAGKTAKVMNIKTLGITAVGALALLIVAISCWVTSHANKSEIKESTQQKKPPRQLIADFVMQVVDKETPATGFEEEQLVSALDRADLADLSAIEPWHRHVTAKDTEIGRNGYEALAWQEELKGNYQKRDEYFRLAIAYSHKKGRPVPKVAKDWALLLCRHNEQEYAIRVLKEERAYCKSPKFDRSKRSDARECSDAITTLRRGGKLSIKEILSDYDRQASQDEAERKKQKRKARKAEREMKANLEMNPQHKETSQAINEATNQNKNLNRLEKEQAPLQKKQGG